MNHKLHEAMNEISDKHLMEAETYQKRRFPYWIAAAAAMLALAFLLGIALGDRHSDPLLDHNHPTNSTCSCRPTPTWAPTRPTAIPQSPTMAPDVPPIRPSGILPPDSPVFANLAAAPTYPQMVRYPKAEDFESFKDYLAATDAYRAAQKAQYDQPDGYADSLTNFFAVSIAQFLQGEGNTAYSPLNVYMAMAMLAETTGGNSRQQILDLFGVETIEELRAQAGHVWNAHYCDDGRSTILMANSLWLDHKFPYHQEAADRLAQYYYASTFHGDLGTEPLDQQLREWLNANTGGLLKEQANNVKLNPETVFALASTIYFSADWADKFYEENTYDETFHAPGGDMQTPFMHQTRRDIYYRGTNFGAIRLSLAGNNQMWLILPDEGFTTEDILKSDEYLQLTLNPGSWYGITYKIHLRLPKFDVVQQQDLIQGMRKLGITDIFNTATSDFSPLSSVGGLYVSMINHAARVTIDETGCTAAAFTVIAGDSAGTPDQVETLYFNLNHPFLFIVSSRDNLPLFAGIVKQP